MQNFLLTIASAIILVIAAAFAAPFVVDWTQWRSTFEEQATRMVGVPVKIGGAIDVQLLPAPKLRLGDVTLGAPDATTNLAIGELRGDFSLGALFRGHVDAEHLTLVRPRLKLELDDLRRLAARPGGGGFSIASLDIQNGALALSDRTGGRSLTFANADLTGALGGLSGPLKLDGEIGADGARRKLRLTLSTLEADGSAKLRAAVQSVGQPFTVDADGTVRLAGGPPRFEGKASVSAGLPVGPGAAAPPALRGVPVAATPTGWSLSATVAASPELVEARELALKLGGSERPVELNGSARFTDPLDAGPQSRLELTLAARQLDLGSATGNQAPLAALNAVAATIAPLSHVATNGALNLSSDTVLIAGSPMRDVKAGLDWSEQGWRARSLEARLPGRASVKLAGRLPRAAQGGAGSELFAGDIDLSAEDLAAFAAWAAPEATGLLAGLPGGAARVQGAMAMRDSEVAFNNATLTVGTMTLKGGGSYAFASGGRGRLQASLSAEGVDLDPMLVPVRRLLAMSGEKLDVALDFKGRKLRIAGVNAGSIDVAVRTQPEGLSIERLALDDFGGLDVSGSGRLAAPSAGAEPAADGRFEARLSGAKADGLPALARTFGLGRVEELIGKMGPMLAPVDVALTLASERGRSDLTAEGRLGVLTGTAQGEFGAGRDLTGKLALNVEDGSAVFARLGVTALRSKLGPARIDVTLDKQFDGELLFAGARLAARGQVGWDEVGRLRPDVNLVLEGADLSRLFPPLALGGIAALPVTASGALNRDGEAWRIEGLAGTVSGQNITGRLAYLTDAPVPIDAELSLARWSLPTALALISGKPVAGGTDWPTGAFGRAPLATLGAAVKLDVATFDLAGGLTLDGAKLRLRLNEGAASVEDITGALAGGRLSGRFDLRRRGDLALVEGHLALTDAEIVQLLRAAGNQRPALRGMTTLNLDFTGSGRSPRAIAASLAGQGSLSVENLEITGVDPSALQFAMYATESGLPPEQARIIQVLSEGLSRGPLKLPRAETTLSLINGLARTGSARFTEGERQFALSGSLDVAPLTFEATLEMEDKAAGATSAAPGASVIWRGPLNAPERRLDVTALSAAINMRALERETRRLDAEFARTPPAAPKAPEPVAPQPAPQSATPILSPSQLAPISVPAAPFPMQPKPAPAPRPKPAPLQPGEVRSAPLQPIPLMAPNTPPRATPDAATPGNAAPPLPPPIDIPVDVLRSPIMQPPLAP